jgi:hypothetical protein
MSKLRLLFLLFTIIGCNGQEKKSSNQNATVSIYENDWKKDKNGCLKLRNKKLADSLILEFNLELKSMDEFTKVFGVPNITDVSENQDVLIYYFNCLCYKNVPTKNSDKCYAEFYFKDKKFIKKIFLCE